MANIMRINGLISLYQKKLNYLFPNRYVNSKGPRFQPVSTSISKLIFWLLTFTQIVSIIVCHYLLHSFAYFGPIPNPDSTFTTGLETLLYLFPIQVFLYAECLFHGMLGYKMASLKIHLQHFEKFQFGQFI